MTDNAIVLQEAKKRMDGFMFGPIDLAIPKGYITAIVGPNGSGKSTLFHVLMNLQQLDSGKMTILEHQYPADDVVLKERIGYMPGEYETIDESMTGLQAIKLIKPYYRRWDEQQYERLIRRFQVDVRQKLSKMSKGMRQRFSFVQTLSASPDLLLLDEPSSGLDPLAWGEMMDEIHRFMEQPERTVVIATHTIEEVRRLADYVVFMYMGQMIGFYEKDRLFAEWKEVWLDQEVPRQQLIAVTGVEWVEGERSYRLITNQMSSTAEELKKLGIGITHTLPVPLDEIMRIKLQSRW